MCVFVDILELLVCTLRDLPEARRQLGRKLLTTIMLASRKIANATLFDLDDAAGTIHLP